MERRTTVEIVEAGPGLLQVVADGVLVRAWKDSKGQWASAKMTPDGGLTDIQHHDSKTEAVGRLTILAMR